MELTNMKGEIKVKKIELYDEDIYSRYAVVTLESGDKFAVSGELENNLVVLNVEHEKNAITPYYIELGSTEEALKAYNYYLKEGIIKKINVSGFTNKSFYEMVEKYECAIKNAIIEHAKLNKKDLIIKFNEYKECPDINLKNTNLEK